MLEGFATVVVQCILSYLSPTCLIHYWGSCYHVRVPELNRPAVRSAFATPILLGLVTLTNILQPEEHKCFSVVCLTEFAWLDTTYILEQREIRRKCWNYLLLCNSYFLRSRKNLIGSEGMKRKRVTSSKVQLFIGLPFSVDLPQSWNQSGFMLLDLKLYPFEFFAKIQF